ncbi:putative peptidase M23B [Magnetofaba australis IT-1]|uniref:Putative peptidase M23B n=2 Tax=Magnetofaba TaxID=1472292 RepID=A0A1Y2K1H7_9PROT|nr:putative peptidase M23B [Magnetofaba australis IT-1]
MASNRAAWEMEPSQRIHASNSGVYRVKPGDTLWAIAAVHNMDVQKLASLNGITDPDMLRVGQELRTSEPARVVRAKPVDFVKGGEVVSSAPALRRPGVSSVTMGEPPPPPGSQPLTQAHVKRFGPPVIAKTAPVAAPPVAQQFSVGGLNLAASNAAKPTHSAAPEEPASSLRAGLKPPVPLFVLPSATISTSKPKSEPAPVKSGLKEVKQSLAKASLKAPAKAEDPGNRVAPPPKRRDGADSAAEAKQIAQAREDYKRSNAWILKAGAPRSWRWPVKGKVISQFGKKGAKRNTGIDIAAKRGEPVRAAAAGVVSYADDGLPGYGNLIILRHGGKFMTAYAHTEKILVKNGQKVRAGQVIAHVGQSGRTDKPKLHFELRKKITPLNPLRYLPKK